MLDHEQIKQMQKTQSKEQKSNHSKTMELNTQKLIDLANKEASVMTTDNGKHSFIDEKIPKSLRQLTFNEIQ